MKRKLSAILAAAMLASSFGMSAMAEESVQARFTDYDQVNQAITVIAGTDTQKELGYLDGVTTILEVDGHKFKDLNGNGQLDVYEDWRQDVDARVKDLYDQMTLEERAGLFYHVNTCGSPMGVDFADSRYMFVVHVALDVVLHQRAEHHQPSGQHQRHARAADCVPQCDAGAGGGQPFGHPGCHFQ